MSEGPVCHLPSPTVAERHDPVPLPNVPIAQPNLASLTATVNALRQLVIVLSGQVGQQGRQGAAGKKGADGKDQPAGSWEQFDLVTENVRIYNPNDKSQYVDVQRVNKLVMRNPQTKQVWTFNRPPNPSGT
jgi:hypothetical protein